MNAAERRREILLRLLVVDVDQLLQLPGGRRAARSGSGGRAGRHPVSRMLAEVTREREARLERLVDEKPPDLLERHRADELLDVDAAVPQRAAVAVGLGDLGLERDDALEARLEVAHGGADGT